MIGLPGILSAQSPFISSSRFIPGTLLKGISTKFSLSPQPSSSDNREAPGMDPQRGRNYEATVENGEREEQNKKAHKAPQNGDSFLSLLFAQTHWGFRFQNTTLWVDYSTFSTIDLL